MIFSKADFCPELNDPVGGTQICKNWGSGGQFKVCEIACKSGLKFSQDIPAFYTCGAEGFWRPTTNPSLPLVYPACSGKTITFAILIFALKIFGSYYKICNFSFCSCKTGSKSFQNQYAFPKLCTL